MFMNDYDFTTEFASDEELEEVLDNIIAAVGEKIEESDSKPQELRVDKAKLVLCTYQALRHMTKGTGAKVTYSINEPYRSMGSVSVVGKSLSFKTPKWLAVLSGYASNFNAYTKTNGEVQMDFTFHGLTKVL